MPLAVVPLHLSYPIPALHRHQHRHPHLHPHHSPHLHHSDLSSPASPSIYKHPSAGAPSSGDGASSPVHSFDPGHHPTYARSSRTGNPTVNHSNNARTRNRNQHQVLDLTTREISEAKVPPCRLSSAPWPIGIRLSSPTKAGVLPLRPVLHQGPQTALERVSSLDPAGVREIRVTHMIQAFQPKQEVVLYKNFAEAFHTYLNGTASASTTHSPQTPGFSLFSREVRPACALDPSLHLWRYSIWAKHSTSPREFGSANSREAIPSTLTLINLFDKIHSPLYVIPSVSIHEGRLVLHSSMLPFDLVPPPDLFFRSDPISGATFVQDPSPGPGWNIIHSCLTKRQNKQFKGEATELNFTDNDPYPDSDTSGGVPDEDETEDEDEDIPAAPPLTAAIAPLPSCRSSHASSTPIPVEGFLHGSLMPESVIALVSSHQQSPPRRLQHRGRDVAKAVYQAAGNNVRLELKAESLEELAMLYGDVVCEGLRMNDFSASSVCKPVLRNSQSQWIDEGRMSLAMSTPLCLASAAPSGRLQNFKIFGALVALSLISGRPPGPLSPALLQYALNDCDLCALTQAVGPTGDLMQFQSEIITYLNIQVATLSIRDQTFHNMLVNQLVHTGLLGPDLHSHPEAAVFCTGLELPGVNGFTFSKFARSYPGGTEFYLANAWTSCITDYAALEPHLLSRLNPETELVRFLKDTGNPSGDRLEASKSHFTEAVIGEMKNIDLPSYCPSMLCWAATGSPFLEPDADPADPNQADFVLPDDLGYSDDPATSAYAMAQGLISFHTCSRFARIPMSKLINLHNTTYPTQDDTSFEDAVDGWLLLQILNAIGKVSML
ncbi:hypothetical protein DFH09DRAFT_1327201 [Mycena vulgaris]|nr:hypothetical protein DFH09DRAFT_1327201 [Mycena vulgaris]